MSPRERAIRELIERLDGLERRVLVDAYRHLVFAHLVASDGKRAVRRLDAEYPGQGVFEPARTGTGEYAFALGSASDMLEGNIQHNDDLAPDTREALRVLLDRLVGDGTFPAPAASPTASWHPKGSGEPPGTGLTGALVAVGLVSYRRANIESGEAMVSYSVDPTERDERTRDHMRLQNDFADFLTSVGVQPLSVHGIDVDLAWREKNEGRLVVGEVKTLNLVNEKRQIRLGLGSYLTISIGFQRKHHLRVECWLLSMSRRTRAGTDSWGVTGSFWSGRRPTNEPWDRDDAARRAFRKRRPLELRLSRRCTVALTVSISRRPTSRPSWPAST